MITIDINKIDQYQNIKSKIMPFDLIAFRGGDKISDLISHVEEKEIGIGTFSHVGMAVTSDILPILPKNKVFVFESTCSFNFVTDGVIDALTQKGCLGVQIRDLEEVIPKYITNSKTKVAWCKLINNPYLIVANREKLKVLFTNIFEKYHNTFYDVSAIDLLSSIFPEFRSIRNVRDVVSDGLFSVLRKCHLIDNELSPSGWQFCSELVANIYQQIGVIPESFDCKDVVPVDFFGCDKDGLPALVYSPVFIEDF